MFTFSQLSLKLVVLRIASMIFHWCWYCRCIEGHTGLVAFLRYPRDARFERRTISTNTTSLPRSHEAPPYHRHTSDLGDQGSGLSTRKAGVNTLQTSGWRRISLHTGEFLHQKPFGPLVRTDYKGKQTSTRKLNHTTGQLFVNLWN